MRIRVIAPQIRNCFAMEDAQFTEFIGFVEFTEFTEFVEFVEFT